MNKKQIIELARSPRKSQTPAENLLWQNLRNRKLNGLKFLRQHPIYYGQFGDQSLFFIADFYCDEKKTVIELDGKIHDFQKDYDQNREQTLTDLGLKILRFNTEDLDDIGAVKQTIRDFAALPKQ